MFFTLPQIQSIYDYGMTAYSQAYAKSREEAFYSAAKVAGAATTIANNKAKMAAEVKQVVMMAGIEATVFNAHSSGSLHRVACDKQFAKSFNFGLTALFSVELIKANENQSYLYGKGYYHIGLYNDSITTLEIAIREEPSCLPNAYYYLAKSHFCIKNYEMAKSYFLHLIEWEENPDRLSDYHDNIGLCFFEQKHYSEAIIHFERAIYYNKANYSAQHNLALLYCTLASSLKSNGENFSDYYLKSQNLLNDIFQSKPNAPHALHTQASLYELIENYEQAITYCLQARAYCSSHDTETLAAIKTNLAEAYAQYGHCFYQSKDYLKAKIFYNKALEEDALHDIAMSQLGMTLFKMSDFTGAREQFNLLINFPLTMAANSNLQAFEHHQEIRADAWINRAACLRKTNSFNLSKGALTIAKDLAPNDAVLPDEHKELAASKIQHEWRFFKQKKQITTVNKDLSLKLMP